MKNGKHGLIFQNLRIGRRDVRPDLPSHVRGVHEGNATAFLKGTRNKDVELVENDAARAWATRSTGINAEDRKPIDPRMPVLTPP